MLLNIKWSDLAIKTTGSQKAIALLMSEMWKAAAESENQALLLTLATTTNTVFSLATALDWAGVKCNGDLLIDR
jgi:hypothetical protein